MPRIHIVTDSGATFSNPRLIKHYPVTILPNHLEIDGKRYTEDSDLSTEESFSLIEQLDAPPKIIPPSENDYAELYAQLAHFYDAVISIHPSRELSDSWNNGRLARAASWRLLRNRRGRLTEPVRRSRNARSVCGARGLCG